MSDYANQRYDLIDQIKTELQHLDAERLLNVLRFCREQATEQRQRRRKEPGQDAGSN